ncbi:hypothetical protein AMTR_s00008p00177610 [Amborella trichopoda]|uniref:Uncharacterized protein n=1 Tax=Amborella trichopoda TaxID=13333 RepID=W1NJJ5_AMBTC|nr:hypothetical protein AMTR_s00008p00177610 [Amborella trichopoda]
MVAAEDTRILSSCPFLALLPLPLLRAHTAGNHRIPGKIFRITPTGSYEGNEGVEVHQQEIEIFHAIIGGYNPKDIVRESGGAIECHRRRGLPDDPFLKHHPPSCNALPLCEEEVFNKSKDPPCNPHHCVKKKCPDNQKLIFNIFQNHRRL